MNIPELSTVMANMKIMDQVGVAVLDKAMETSEASAASIINMMDRSMMEQSVTPHLGGNIDLTV